MPSTSKKQKHLMAACAHGAGYSSCPPAKVAKEFNQADKRADAKGKRKLPEHAHVGMLREHGLYK